MHPLYMRTLLLAGLILALTACGSSRSEEEVLPAAPPAFGVDGNGIAFLGADRCIRCHAGPIPDAERVEAYLGGKHVRHSAEINAASPVSCLSCHDPLGDGRTLESALDPAAVPTAGLAAVGCEICHGAGGDHFGVGAIPQASPGAEVCGSCHGALPAGPAPHTRLLAEDIIGTYRSGAHADTLQGTQSLCDRCHSDEGFRAFIDQTRGLDGEQLALALNRANRPAALSAIQCRTCHDSHSGQLRAAPTVAIENGAEQVSFSREFNLCTSCHQVFLTASFDPASGRYDYLLDPARAPFHGTAGGAGTADGRLIWDTHFRQLDPANPANVLIAGYNINAGSERACSSCHDPHGATKFAQAAAQTIAQTWSTSGHADYRGEPFGAGITQAACLKCHSGGEYGRFVQGVAVADLDPAKGAQVIACVACHDLQARDTGGNFALGALRSVESVMFPSGAVRSINGASNLCMECHQGRSSTPTVNARIAAGNLSFSNIHYFAAAATLFGSEVQGGYEYPGRSYRGRNGFNDHQALGLPQFTTCNGCHLGNAADHSFAVPLSNCNGCHPGTTFQNLIGSPGINFTQIQTLKTQLLGLLTASGVVALEGFPYFQNITTEQQLKAAYNWQVADKEPCGNIHNGLYIRQLLFDSIVDMGGTPNAVRP